MICPECKSDSMQRLEVIWVEGISHSQSRSTSYVNKPLGFIPERRVDTNTQEVNISRLAVKCSPPSKKNIGSVLLFCFLSIISLMNIDITNVRFISGLCFIISIVMIIYKISYNQSKYPNEYEEWERTWFCHSCGKFYIKNKKREVEIALVNKNIIEATNQFGGKDK